MKITLRKLIVPVLLIIIFRSNISLAQTITLNTTNINSNNGLSQNTIQCIYKDSYGFMWFGTQDGLNKYDGLNFTIYKNSKNDPSSIAANLVNTICEDAGHNLWIGTRLGGLSRYNRAHDSFLTYQTSAKNPNSISNNSVNIVYIDKQSNLWIGTENGLNLFDKTSGRFRRYFNDNKNPESLSSSFISSIFEDTGGNLWIGTAKGLNLLDVKSGKCQRFLDKTSGINGDNNKINAILEDDQKHIWVGTGKGLDRINRETRSFTYYAITPDKNLAGDINSIFCLDKTAGNKFWIGSNTTLQLFDAEKSKIIPVSEKTNGESLMPNDGISALWEDNAGILWIGTTSTGIHKFDRNLTIFPSYKASLTNNPSATNIIRSLTEDKKGNIYLGTDFGIEYYNRITKQYTTYRHSKADVNSLAGNYTLTVLCSKKSGLVWVGTYSNGLDCFDPATKKFRHFGVGAGKIQGKGIYALIEDHSGNIWFGPDGGGVYEYNPVKDQFTRFIHDDNNPNSVCDNTIQAMYEDREAHIWMGSYSYGISVFDPQKKTFKQINSTNSQLTSNVISAFYEDKAGNMWIGTMEGGLNCYQSQSHTFKAYTEKNGIINNTINYISGDDQGNIWLSTIRGIVRLDPLKQDLRNYGYNNGLKSMEFNFGTGTKLKTGEIVFGSINGFDIIDPAHLYLNNNKPAVAITGFDLFNKPVVPGEKDSPLSQSIATTKNITLNRLQSIFSIDFAALDYTIPEKNEFAYKLEGFDKDWRFVDTHPQATYTNLDPGDYIFKVKAANADGIWSDEETAMAITIIPPYWMTWWFRLLVLLLLIGFAYVIYLYRVRSINLQEIQLKKEVKGRTLEIAQQAHYLQALNSELKQQKEQEERARLMAENARLDADKANKAKSTFLATMSHEIRTPLNGVFGMAALLNETEQTQEQKEYTSSIMKSSDSLLLVINDILDFSRIESGNLSLDPHEFNVKKCIDDLLELFTYRASDAGIQLHYVLEKNVPAVLIGDSLRLRQVLTNLIGNALKFTSRGEILINIASKETAGNKIDLCFEVKDTGIGIMADKIGNLFQAFNQVDSSITRKYGGSGLGLVISDRLVKLMGGEIKVKSTYGKGSSFTFNISCSKCASADHPKTIVADQTSYVSKPQEAKIQLSEDFAISYPMSILVAEDNLLNQKVLLRILSKLGYKADLANDGVEVLGKLTESSCDLILMDIQMPNLDGLEATRAIRKIYGVYPLIAAMTANALSEDKENCFNAGMNDYMSKPISIELLKNKLTELFIQIQHHKYSLSERIIK